MESKLEAGAGMGGDLDGGVELLGEAIDQLQPEGFGFTLFEIGRQTHPIILNREPKLMIGIPMAVNRKLARSPLVPWPGYRMLPHTGLGAGSFVMLWQREATGERRSLPTDLAAAHIQASDI